ncbi:Prenylcysteine oxidase [Acipenser ruthenus]|uniref:Prenylcysteine oxidase 1 n=2 Tax=Acipenser ruthenus TaxID=7906 RepID=A0A444US64_ACIRT|nr:Prenylcysteine oxidase [Acipenser ruthenus]
MYEVSYTGQSGAAHSLYDIVFIATPLHPGISDISFPNFSPPIPSHFSGRYHQTVATLVQGRLNTSYFGLHFSGDSRVSEVLMMEREGLAVHSVSSLDPVTVPQGYSRPPASQPKVWKVFSPAPLSEAQLGALFLSRDAVSETRWLAYPTYTLPRGLPPVVLHDRLYYLSGIEWAASAMEMSAIAARNAVLLAHHRWHGTEDRTDQEDLHSRLKNEL